MRKVLVLLGVLACLAVFFVAQNTLSSGAPPEALALVSVQPSATAAPAKSLPDDMSVLGQPTLSVEVMNRVLAHYHSPATGTAQTLYDLSRSYTIDDAFALAFFGHESVFGTLGWAKVNLSLGNIRCEPQYACDGGYAQYTSWQESYHDWFRLIHDLYIVQLHLTTVRGIIHRYAPAADNNDEDAYVHAVVAQVAAWRTGEVQS